MIFLKKSYNTILDEKLLKTHQKPLGKNYIYYLFGFLLTALFSFLNILYFEKEAFWTFLIISLLQLSITTLIFILLESLPLSKFLLKLLRSIYFLYIIVFLIDFALLKLINRSIIECFLFIVDETFENFIELLTLSSIPLYIWLFALTFLILSPFIANYLFNLYRFPIIQKKKILCSLLILLSLLLCFDITTEKDALIYQKRAKLLPWKFSLFHKEAKTITLPSYIKKPKNIIAKKRLKKDDNIYLFVVESIRRDSIKEDISPFLYELSKNSICSEKSFANANNSHNSWYSIFFANYPFFCKSEKSPSPFLKVLKEMGYKINLYSSTNLKYYKIDEIIFGKGHSLLDSIYLPKDKNTAIRDLLLFENLKGDIEKKRSKNLFIIFLDSTHFPYSVPKNFKAPFKPILERFSPFFKKNISKIKNRYRNSINFLDHLFKEFVNTLKKEKLYKDSIIIFTSDHGEEFFDEGYPFHISHLSDSQITVPIFYKFGKLKKEVSNISSQVDIFPTLFCYLFGSDVCENHFNGRSLLSKKRDISISTNYNAGHVPKEFAICGEEKIILKFEKGDIFHDKKLKILSKNYKKELLLKGIKELTGPD